MFFKKDLNNFFKKIETSELSNGVRIVFYEDNRLPEVAVNIMFHVGSKDEKDGERGYAHLVEHLMFQGSLNSPVDFFKALEKYGARVNGGTTEDRTIYWEVVPKGVFEYLLFLESDRLKTLFPYVTNERLFNQIEVVKNEKRQIVENQPYGVANEAISELLFPEGHPYRHPVLGYFEDLNNVTLEKMKNFFNRFYVPQNASIAVCGDISKNKAFDLLEEYFGSIPSGKYYPPMKEWVPQIKGTPSLSVESNVELKRIFYLWTAPSFFSEENRILFLISRLLSKGKDSPLQKRLVVENPLCQSVSASLFSGEVCSVFAIIATLRKSGDEEKVENIIVNEIEKLKKDGIEKKELNSILRGIESARLKGLENLGGFGGLSDILNFYQLYYGDPRYFEKEFFNLLETKEEEISEFFKTCLSTSDYAKLSIKPRKSLKNFLIEKPEAKPLLGFHLKNPISEKFRNGASVFKLKESHIPFSTFIFMFKKGSKNDPIDKPGLAEMVCDLLDEGSKGKTNIEIAKELKEIGAFYETNCDRETISVSLSLPSKFEKKGLEILSSMALHPDFPEEELERVKKLKKSAILRDLKAPETLGIEISKMVLWGKNSPYGHPANGRISTIDKIKRDEIFSFYKEITAKENIVFLAVGDFKDDSVDFIKKEIDYLPTKGCSLSDPFNTKSEKKSKLYFIRIKDLPSSFICAFTATVERDNPIFPSLSIFNMILGGQFTSRLNKKMREEKGYTYGVQTYFLFQKGDLPWFLNSTVELNKTAEAVSDILCEIDKITESETPRIDEFEEAKNGFLARFIQNFETQEQRALNFAKLIAYGFPLNFYEEYYKRFEKTSLDEVIENSKEIFKKENISFLIVGDVDKNHFKGLPFDEPIELTPQEFF